MDLFFLCYFVDEAGSDSVFSGSVMEEASEAVSLSELSEV